jgi:hypothetical protein
VRNPKPLVGSILVLKRTFMTWLKMDHSFQVHILACSSCVWSFLTTKQWLGVSKFERSAIYTMTPTLLALQFCSMVFQSQKEHFTHITTSMPGPLGLPGVIIWPAACEILMGVLERTNKSDCGKAVLRHMSDVIRLRAKSNKCPPPILFMLQPPQGSLNA